MKIENREKVIKERLQQIKEDFIRLEERKKESMQKNHKSDEIYLWHSFEGCFSIEDVEKSLKKKKQEIEKGLFKLICVIKCKDNNLEVVKDSGIIFFRYKKQDKYCCLSVRRCFMFCDDDDFKSTIKYIKGATSYFKKQKKEVNQITLRNFVNEMKNENWCDVNGVSRGMKDVIDGKSIWCSDDEGFNERLKKSIL